VERGKPFLQAIGVAALLGGILGLVLMPATSYALSVGMQIQLLYAPIVGLWFLPPVTAMLLLRRPGVGFVASAVAGVMMSIAPPFEARTIFGMAVLGVVLELGVAVRRYRSWDKPIFAVTILFACALHGWSTWRSLDVASIGLPGQVAFFVLLLLSAQGALILAALIARFAEATWIRRIQGEHADPASGSGWPVVTDGGWRYDRKSATKPETTP
jgi:energy-coupling factor transport system permease protein